MNVANTTYRAGFRAAVFAVAVAALGFAGAAQADSDRRYYAPDHRHAGWTYVGDRDWRPPGHRYRKGYDRGYRHGYRDGRRDERWRGRWYADRYWERRWDDRRWYRDRYYDRHWRVPSGYYYDRYPRRWRDRGEVVIRIPF